MPFLVIRIVQSSEQVYYCVCVYILVHTVLYVAWPPFQPSHCNPRDKSPHAPNVLLALKLSLDDE